MEFQGHSTLVIVTHMLSIFADRSYVDDPGTL
jgi:hypothetical protein